MDHAARGAGLCLLVKVGSRDTGSCSGSFLGGDRIWGLGSVESPWPLPGQRGPPPQMRLLSQDLLTPFCSLHLPPPARAISPHGRRPGLYSHTRKEPVQNTFLKNSLGVKNPRGPSSDATPGRSSPDSPWVDSALLGLLQEPEQGVISPEGKGEGAPLVVLRVTLQVLDHIC